MVYFTRYRPDKISNNVKSFIWWINRKDGLMVDDYTLGKALGKIKRICIEKIDNIIRSLVDVDHNVSGGITF